MNIIISFCRKHMSLLVIVLGAVGFFSVNLLLKEELNNTDYGIYSIFITYFSLINLFGLLGLEQVYLRYSHFVEKNIIQTPIFVHKLIIGTNISFALISTFIFYFYFRFILEFNIFIVLLSSLSIIALLYLHNIFRLNADYFLSQLFFNIWKICLPINFYICYVFQLLSVENLFLFIMLSIILSFLIAVIVCYKKINFQILTNVKKSIILNTSVQFLLSIAAFSILLFGDRLIIETKFGVEEFGNYFYLSNFFLAPFTILQNYVGFKQLIAFKNNFSKHLFIKECLRTIKFAFALAIVLFIISQVLQMFFTLKFNFNSYFYTIILLLILGIVRLYSAIVTSAFEARTNYQTLRKGNIAFITVCIFVLFINFMFVNSLQVIIISIIFIWIIRSLVFKYLLINQFYNEN